MKTEELRLLFEQMTLEEKIGQLAQTTGNCLVDDIGAENAVTGPDMDLEGLTESRRYMVGSVLGVSSAKEINRIQKKLLDNSRLGIPLLFMHDCIHGYRTIYPIPLALSCSFDRELVKAAGAHTAEEMRASGIHVDFSPMTDLVRDPRWGRVMEAFGEDHKLSGEMGKAMIEGYQQSEDGSIGKNGVAACLKHFAGYGAPEGGKDYASVDMSLKEFFGYYAVPYEISLQAKPRFVMSSFNSFNGEPVTGSRFMLKDVLRERFGFEHILISDWGAVEELKNHGVVADDREAAMAALEAGVDIEMVSTTYMKHGEQIINDSPELQKQVDDAVWKILCLKNELGLFENPYVDEAKEAEVIMSEKMRTFAKEAAVKSAVLLKNDNILPVSKEVKEVVVLGKFATTGELLGNWLCKGEFSETVSVTEGLKQLLPNAHIEAYERIEDCGREKIESSDLVLVTIGEEWNLSGEAHSSANIELEAEQQEMIRRIRAVRKDFVCVAFAGRPLALESVIDEIPALLWCWFPGTMAGAAVAELVLGDAVPCGKLTMSFPRTTAQIPVRYNQYRCGRPASDQLYSSKYQDIEDGALFPFGYGLSYGDVAYGQAEISSDVITDENGIEISLKLTNESSYDKEEIVILYMEDPVSGNVRPVREMLQYKKVALKASEQKEVLFKVYAEELKYMNSALQKVLEPGTIRFYINDLETPVAEVIYKNRVGGK